MRRETRQGDERLGKRDVEWAGDERLGEGGNGQGDERGNERGEWAGG